MVEGTNFLLVIVGELVGTTTHHIKKCNLINAYRSNPYYYAGTTLDEKRSQHYVKVEKRNLEYCKRNRTSIWNIFESHEGACHGIRVKYSCGSNTPGYIFTTAMMFSGFSEKMPAAAMSLTMSLT